MELNNLPYSDRACVSTLITEILASPDLNVLSITVNDGEEDTVIRSRDMSVILEAMATTDWDYIKVHQSQPDGSYIDCGWFWLIYGNGGEPMECISDYAWNPQSEDIMNAIYQRVEQRLEQ